MAQELERASLARLERPDGSRKDRKRVGRGTGSGLGKTAGRGGKGQTARAGKGRPRGFEGGQTPLQRRLPKFGFKNPFRREYAVVNLADLDKKYAAGETVNPETLLAKGILRNNNELLKILGDGNLTKKLIVHAHRFSKSAAQKINQLGGEVHELALPNAKPEET